MSSQKKTISKKKHIKNTKQFKLTCLVVSLLLGFMSILFDAFLLYVNILPMKYLLPLLTILSLFELLFIYILIKRKFKLWLKIISIFFSIIFSFIFIIGCTYIFKTYDFMDKIKSKNVQTEEYYIMVNKDSNIEKIEELNDKTINTFDEKVEIYNKAIDKLKEIGNFNLENVDSVDKMVNNLINNEVDAIIISSVHKEMMAEEIDEFDSKTKIIYTISVEVKKQTEVKKPEVNVTREAFTIYVSGIDTYGSISKRSRSDVNMLVTVNPKTHQVLLTSIPRDYYVQLHGTTGYKDKLTHAGIYGIDMSVMTLEDLLDINIDYYVRVNFSTLIKVVDTIGGIDVYSDKGFTPWTDRSIYIPKGNVHMNGKMALAFARERKTYIEGDRHRVKNQQDVITAIIKKVTSSTTILTKYTALLDQLSSSFETNVEAKMLTDLIKMQIDKMPSWNIEQISLNGSDASEYTYSYGNQKLYVMIPNSDTISRAKKYISEMELGKEITISDSDKFVAGDSSHINVIPSTNSSSNDVPNKEESKPDDNKEPTQNEEKTDTSSDLVDNENPETSKPNEEPTNDNETSSDIHTSPDTSTNGDENSDTGETQSTDGNSNINGESSSEGESNTNVDSNINEENNSENNVNTKPSNSDIIENLEGNNSATDSVQNGSEEI